MMLKKSQNFTTGSTPPTPIDRWGIVRNWVEDNQKNLVLVVGVILIAAISFGLGTLIQVGGEKEPAVIEVPKVHDGAAGAVLSSLEQVAGSEQEKSETALNVSAGQESKSDAENVKKQGNIVASKSGAKYHWPWCSYAKKIKPENQVWFNSEAEAQKAGYEQCSSFQKLAPAGYKP